MNKFIVTALAFIFCASSLYAQKLDIIPVEWKNISNIAKSNPDSIKKLVARLSAEELDTTLTMDERILAVFGQTYIIKPHSTRATRALINKGSYENACTEAINILKNNPLNIEAIDILVTGCSYIKENKRKDIIETNELKRYKHIMMRVLNTIAKTGYGTRDYPFAATTVDDEYLFMYIYLELSRNDIAQQKLLKASAGMEDVFALKGSSKYYDDKEICFDVNRVLELEQEMFK